MQFRGRSIAVAVALLASGCSPTFDWREVRTAEGVAALFPCRPQFNSRQLVIAGDTVTMSLASCTAGGLTFAVGRMVGPDESRVRPIMQVLQQALRVNLSLPAQAADSATQPPPGQAELVSVDGVGPDGEPLQARSRIFSLASTVFQATVMGRKVDPEIVDFFFSSIKPG